MARPSKSQNPEFLARRRKAIADLADRRRRLQILRASGIALGRGNSKIVTRLTLSGPASPPQT